MSRSDAGFSELSGSPFLIVMNLIVMNLLAWVGVVLPNQQGDTDMTSRSMVRRTALFLLVFVPALLVARVTGAGAQEGKPTIAVTSVELNAGTIEVTNTGDADVDPNGLIFCNFPAYAGIEGAAVIAPGETITIDSAAHGVALDAAGGEMGISTVAEYENPDAMITYVEWGTTGHQRSPIAVQAGVWAEGVAEAVDRVLTASVDSPAGPADWAVAGAQADEADEAESTELAVTGVNSALLAVIATTVLAAGAMFVSSRRRMT